MDFFSVINSRRSVRKFKSTVVPDAVIEKALEATLKAPNSSNLQPWEFYWVQSESAKTELVNACLFQSTAKMANHLVVAVARIDTWKRNRDYLLGQMKKDGGDNKMVTDYYTKLIPFIYTQDPFGVMALVRFAVMNAIGLFKPMARGPVTRKDLFETVVKTTALGCENFMLAIAAQGYGTCPMEGFDEARVKKILKLDRKAKVVMVISVGDIDTAGIYGPQYRVPADWVVHRV